MSATFSPDTMRISGLAPSSVVSVSARAVDNQANSGCSARSFSESTAIDRRGTRRLPFSDRGATRIATKISAANITIAAPAPAMAFSIPLLASPPARPG